MAKTTHVTTSAMPKKSGVTDRRIAVAPVRLGRTKPPTKGLGKPN